MNLSAVEKMESSSYLKALELCTTSRLKFNYEAYSDRNKLLKVKKEAQKFPFQYQASLFN